MPRATQPVSINGIEFDALISEQRSLSATVPQYSVEDGFAVSDAIILDPEKLQMNLFVTNTPVTWYSRHGVDQNRVNDVCKQLEELYYKAEPVTIVTTDATYTDMAIESLELSKPPEGGYSREIPISFVKIRITKAKTTIPDSYGKAGATAAQAGTASTSAGSSSGSSSGGGGGEAAASASASTSAAPTTQADSWAGEENKSSILYKAASALGLFGG